MTRRIAIVTGASGGIGSALVAALWGAGYGVYALGHTQAKLDALLDTYPPQDVWGTCLDFRTATAVTVAAALQPLLREQGHIDLLVCAHGAPPCTTPTLALTSEQVEAIWRVDVLGTFLMAQAVGEWMVRARAGCLVFISSAHTRATYPARLPYVLAKSSIVAMARSLAVEWGPAGVRANSISPWQVLGERGEAIAQHERDTHGIDTLELYRQRSPLRRLVTPDDVAKTVLWLAENTSMSGADVTIDCGVSGSMWHQPFLEPFL